MGPASLFLDTLAHRLEGVRRVTLAVVRADPKHPDPAIGVVTGDVEHPVVPGEGVGAVVAGPVDDGRRGAVIAQRMPGAVDPGELEVGGSVSDLDCDQPSSVRLSRRPPS